MSTASDATKTGKLRLGGSNLWLFLLLASMILFGVNTGVATWQGSRLADAGSKAADLQVLSQQLANQGREAVAGNAQAFTAFKATRTAIDENVATLQGRYGAEPGVSAPIGKLVATWQPLAKSAAQLVSSEPAVLTLAGTTADNTASHVSTGHNAISAGAFANMSGMPVVIQNSGANVLIQSAVILNLQMN